MVTTPRAGRSEKRVFRDRRTDREIWQMTRSDQASFHSYYDLCPWSPDGMKIIFCAMTPGQGSGDIYWMDALEGTLHRCGHSRAVNPHTGAHQQWLGDGERFAYEDADAGGRVVRVVELATGAVARVAGAMRMVSPDGRLFASHTDPHDEVAIARRESAGLSLTPVAGGAARLVASLAAALELHPQRGTIAHRHLYIKHPKWSPAGDRLFFVFTNEIHYERLYGEPRVKDIYALDADGGNLRHVCSFPLGHHPSWHPDGRRILLNRRPAPDAPFQFLLVDAATGAAEVATDLIAGGGHPLFAPDGERLVAEYVTAARAGTGRVVCVDLARSRVDDLAHFPVVDHTHEGTHIHPTWSRDGRFVLYNADSSGSAEIYVVPLTA